MSALAISVVVFACVFGGALLGIFPRGSAPAPPEQWVEGRRQARDGVGRDARGSGPRSPDRVGQGVVWRAEQWADTARGGL